MATFSSGKARAPKKEVTQETGENPGHCGRSLEQGECRVLEKPVRSPGRDWLCMAERGILHQGDLGMTVS